MSASEVDFTPLERAVLAAICEKYPSDRSALEAQLATARVRNRENTGHGFFTKVDVKKTPDTALPPPRLRDGPQLVSVHGLKHGMGFILWLTDGFASSLEGYAYADSTVELDLETAEFTLSTEPH